MALVLVLAALPLLTCCQTARGLADDGQLQQACMAVERAPSPNRPARPGTLVAVK